MTAQSVSATTTSLSLDIRVGREQRPEGSGWTTYYNALPPIPPCHVGPDGVCACEPRLNDGFVFVLKDGEFTRRRGLIVSFPFMIPIPMGRMLLVNDSGTLKTYYGREARRRFAELSSRAV